MKNTNKIKKLINNSTAVLVVLFSCYLFLPNIATAQVINALPGVLQNTQFFLEQMNGGTLPPLSPTNSYDFASDFFSLNGNISPVSGCRTNQFGQTVSFFDNFNDGSLTTGCTANFQTFGTFQESGGFLHMNSDFAILVGTEFRGHTAQANLIINDGGGDTELITSFRPDIPNPFPTQTQYGMILVDDLQGPFFESSVLQIQPGAPGQTLVSAFRSAPIPPGPTINNFTTINLTGLTRIVLKLRFEDASNRVFPSYSTDGGTTFIPLRNPDNSLFFMPAFTVPGQTQARAQIFAAERLLAQTMIRPTTNGTIICDFHCYFNPKTNSFHEGIDIDRNIASMAVKAVASGRIEIIHRDITPNGGAGRWVWVSHGDIRNLSGVVVPNISSRYLHLNTISSSLVENQNINQDTVIGTVGNTGTDTPHLHFETRQGVISQTNKDFRLTTALDPKQFVQYPIIQREFFLYSSADAPDFVIRDPDGLVISKTVNQLPGIVNYIDVNYSGSLEGEGIGGYDKAVFNQFKIGDYAITVLPVNASITDFYTLKAIFDGQTVTLIENARIADIPSVPFIVRVSSSSIQKIIPVKIRIEPKTLNLSSQGVLTSFIQIPKGFGATINDINPSTITLSGAPTVSTTVNAGTNLLIAKFNRRDLVNVVPGLHVKLVVQGKLFDNTVFEGSDTLRIINSNQAQLSSVFSSLQKVFSWLTGLLQKLLVYFNPKKSNELPIRISPFLSMSKGELVKTEKVVCNNETYIFDSIKVVTKPGISDYSYFSDVYKHNRSPDNFVVRLKAPQRELVYGGKTYVEHVIFSVLVAPKKGCDRIYLTNAHDPDISHPLPAKKIFVWEIGTQETKELSISKEYASNYAPSVSPDSETILVVQRDNLSSANDYCNFRLLKLLYLRKDTAETLIQLPKTETFDDGTSDLDPYCNGTNIGWQDKNTIYYNVYDATVKVEYVNNTTRPVIERRTLVIK